jgi:hypothetical protein
MNKIVFPIRRRSKKISIESTHNPCGMKYQHVKPVPQDFPEKEKIKSVAGPENR